MYRLIPFIFFLSVHISSTSQNLNLSTEPHSAFWSNLGNDGKIKTPEYAIYTHPNGEKGWYYHGFELLNDGTINGWDYKGIAFDIELVEDDMFVGFVEAELPDGGAKDNEIFGLAKANFILSSVGEHRVILKWDDFNINTSNDAWVKFIKTIRIGGKYNNSSKGKITISNVKFIKAVNLDVHCDIKGKAAKASEEVEYQLTLSNYSEKSIGVNIKQMTDGWEEMPVTIVPNHITIAKNQSTKVSVFVKVTDRIPKGNYEVQNIIFNVDGRGDKSQSLELYTSRYLESPNLMFDSQGWEDIVEKTKHYDWARKKLEKMVIKAQKWEVPQNAALNLDPLTDVAPKDYEDFKAQPYNYTTRESSNAINSAQVWQMTRDIKYAKKPALFLSRLFDPIDGYLKTRRGCNDALVQEGYFFAQCAYTYDLIKDADVLSVDDHKNIECAFRFYKEVVETSLRQGNIGNWQVAESLGGMLCALTLNDMELANHFIHGRTKLLDIFSAGFMSDGWWFECSIGYSAAMANEYLDAAIALKPRGIDWINKGFKLRYSPDLCIYPNTQIDKAEFEGMDYIKYGPVTRSSITIKDIFVGMLPFIDYRGVAFGTNDNQAKRIGGDIFEKAYSIYGDEAFLPMLTNLAPENRSLLHGVPELPEVDLSEKPQSYEVSFHADNIGYAVLRSQNQDIPINERIHAALKYGSHGGHHGHFDRTNLVDLSRYGKQIGPPKGVWFSYVPVMYKFFNQSSTQHNMVVVDQKMQEPVESDLLMFHSGEILQVAAVETNARWSYPPALNQGELFDNSWQHLASQTTKDRTTCYDYSEPVRQRRMLLVTDDYVVVIDDLKSDSSHTFDNSLWIKGYKKMTAAEKTFITRKAQLDNNPKKAAQLITNCDWYDISGTSKVEFSYEIKEGTKDVSYYMNEPGEMNFNIFAAWPQKKSAAIVDLPISDQKRKLWWKITDDGNVLADGYTRPWTIGDGKVDLDITGKDNITLETQLEYRSLKDKNNFLSLFWAGYIETNDGEKIDLADIKYSTQNIISAKEPGKDYWGGNIELLGLPYSKAIGAEPDNNKETGVITFNLEGLNAKRFVAQVASDHPIGVKDDLRKGFIVREEGKKACFINVIEPFESTPMVQSVTATNAENISVKLVDGREHRISIQGLDRDNLITPITASFEEYVNGKLAKSEKTK